MFLVVFNHIGRVFRCGTPRAEGYKADRYGQDDYQCHSSLARSTATTLAPLLDRHSALCADFGVSAIYGDTHHNRCFATLAKSGAANEEVY